LKIIADIEQVPNWMKDDAGRYRVVRLVVPGGIEATAAQATIHADRKDSAPQ
jgi:hypothetical protein